MNSNFKTIKSGGSRGLSTNKKESMQLTKKSKNVFKQNALSSRKEQILILRTSKLVSTLLATATNLRSNLDLLPHQVNKLQRRLKLNLSMSGIDKTLNKS